MVTCNGETKAFPAGEKFGLIQQIRRAALSVHLNLAEGCSRKSAAERKRFYEIARGSLIEIDASLNIAVLLNYTTREKLHELGRLIVRSFQMLSNMI